MSGSDKYAGFWMRFVAIVIDGIVIQILQSFIIFPLLGAIGFSALAGAGFDPNMLNEDDILEALPALIAAMGSIIIASQIIYILYFSLMESSKYQATLGKMALGLKVTDENGGKLSLAKSIIRNIGKIVSAIILYIGYIMAGLTSKKQALHDMMAGALVVKK